MLRRAGRPSTFTCCAVFGKLRASAGPLFSLANDPPELAPLFARCAEPYPAPSRLFTFHHSDEPCAATLIGLVRERVRPGSVIVIDHLQLLDQRRSAPGLQQQVQELTAFARQTGCILVCLSQLQHAFDGEQRPPGPGDVRLPNPLDLRVFDKLLFLHRGTERLHAG